jgi:rhodanese-related sulfurtransferase
MGFFGNIFGGNNNNENLATLVNDGAFLVDVRTHGEFAEGNVQGSTNIPLDQIAANLDKFKGKENIVVFCRSGNRSSQAKSILEQNGFINVTNGGTWQDVNEVINK